EERDRAGGDDRSLGRGGDRGGERDRLVHDRRGGGTCQKGGGVSLGNALVHRVRCAGGEAVVAVVTGRGGMRAGLERRHNQDGRVVANRGRADGLGAVKERDGPCRHDRAGGAGDDRRRQRDGLVDGGVAGGVDQLGGRADRVDDQAGWGRGARTV